MVVAVHTTGLLHESLPVGFRMTPESFSIYPIFLLTFIGLLIVGGPGRVEGFRLAATASPKMIHSDLVPSDGYAKYADDLAPSMNVASSFSPTDVPAIRRWARLMMVLESLISLTLATLVMVRAVNIL
jgi:hypothetical protein